MNRIIDLPAQKPENPIVQDDRSQSCKYRRPIARAEQIAYCHHADQDDERHDISQQNRDRSRSSGYSDRHPVAGTIRRRSRSTYLHDFLPGLTQTAGFAGLAAPTSAMSRNFHTNPLRIDALHHPAMFDTVHRVTLHIYGSMAYGTHARTRRTRVEAPADTENASFRCA